jgi:predicted AlkP superfamily phosphohydrolase/phosphomutase
MNEKTLFLVILVILMSFTIAKGETIKEEKILIIGLEGLSPELLTSLMNDGKLPNLSSLIKNGIMLNLTSPLPLVSPVTWTSFSTGKNPGKHGIFGWQQCDLDSYKTYIPLSNDIKAKTFWEILSENGKRGIIINAYLTYPPKPINGIIVSGMPSPYLSTYPPELKEELEKKGYKVEAKGYVYTPINEFIEDLYNTAEIRKKVALKLMDSEDWNLFFILFPEIDRIQHCCWKDVEENGKHKKEVLKFYEFIDEKVGEIVKKAGNATIFIISDHGFRKSEKRFHVNQWLLKEGYLKLKPTLKNFVNSIMLKATYILRKMELSDLILKFGKIAGKELSEIKSLEFDIDYNNSKAFACAFYETSIYINPKLDLNEREKIKEEIARKLKELKNNNEKVFKEVYKNNEIYNGAFLNISPDIILIPNEGYLAVGDFSSQLFECSYKETGTHKQGGILIVNKKFEIKEASIMDIAPTVLRLMKINIPEDFDGKPLFE